MCAQLLKLTKLPVVLCLVLLVSGSLQTVSQSRAQLWQMSGHQCARLIERWNLSVEYQRTQQWDKIDGPEEFC